MDVWKSKRVMAWTVTCLPEKEFIRKVLRVHLFTECGMWRGWGVVHVTVETIQRGGRVTIHYTDYGDRSMRYKERMMSMQLMELKLLLPDSNQ